MNSGDWIAGYAAIVSTAALGWQTVTYAQSKRPRLKISFEPMLFPNGQEQELELLAVMQGLSDSAPSVSWFTDIRVSNAGRSRVQLNGLRLSQDNDNPHGSRGWDGTTRLGTGRWIEPGETATYRFTSDDLENAKLTTPIRVSILAGHDRTFEVTGTIANAKSLLTLPYLRMQEIMEQLGGKAPSLYVLEVTDLGDDT
jgi:hypothetical protein